MHWQLRIVGGIGLLLATIFLLFPRWHWIRYSGGDVGTPFSRYSLVSLAPTPDASIAWDETGALEGGIIILTAGTIFLLHSRTKDKQAEVHWRTKWDYAMNNPDTLLRASDESAVQSDVLLRAAAGRGMPKEELLRVSRQFATNADGSGDLR